MSQLFASGGQSIGASTSASVLPMNIQGWCPLGWTGWMSLQSRGLSGVFSSTTVQRTLLYCCTTVFLTTLPFFLHPLSSWLTTVWICLLVLREGLGGWSLFFANNKQGTQSLFVPGGPHRVLPSFKMVPLQAELCPPQKPFVEILTLSPS